MKHDTYTEQAIFYEEALVSAAYKGAEYYDSTVRELLLSDLWFMMTFGLNRSDMVQRPEIDPQFLYERCWDIQEEPDGYLDLWARDHYKSTIITFGKTIQDILTDQEDTFGIFSVTVDLAQDFVKMIKQEFEENNELKRLFPNILYSDPKKQSPAWGLKAGLRVKRQSNRREETVEAHGLMGGSLPAGKHFGKLIYDDVVTEKSITNFEQLTKAFSAMRLSFSLGTSGGARRMIGTRYHNNDAWGQTEKRKIAKVRVHPATHNGKINGRSIFLEEKILHKKKLDLGMYHFGCQMLQNPKADKVMGFEKSWLRRYERPNEAPRGWNLYLLVDPSSGKNKKTDYTVMLIIALAPDGNYYLVDGFRKRINLTARAKELVRLHERWNPLKVGYEAYGMQADIEHIEDYQDRINYRFDIEPLGGSQKKENRIRKLVPPFEQGKFYIPYTLFYMNEEKKLKDLIVEFIDEEYEPFPVSSYDDMLDCMARILDPKLKAKFPIKKKKKPLKRAKKYNVSTYSQGG